MVFTDDIVRALLAVGRQVALGEAELWWPATPVQLKIVRRRRGSPPMWTSLGVKPVAAVTDCCTQIRRKGAAHTQLFLSSLTTIASIWAVV